MKIAILGRTSILYHTIDFLTQRGHDIVLIGTCAAADEYDIREKDFELKAEEMRIPFFNDSHINSSSVIDLLKSVNADIAVSVNWRTIIRKEAMECFKYGILNGHCGDLPRYRGNACPNWAIIKGDNSYAISIHYMEPGELDAGNIIVKRKFQITNATTITDIYDNMNRLMPEMFSEAVDLIDKYKTMGTPQSKNPCDSLRCYPRVPSDSFIDWHLSCENISRIIRASCAPFAGAYTYYGEKKLYIMEAEIRDYESPCYVYPGQIVKIQDGIVDIAAADGIVRVREFIIEGITHKASDVIKSIRIRLNYVLEDEIFRIRNDVTQLQKQVNILQDIINSKHK